MQNHEIAQLLELQRKHLVEEYGDDEETSELLRAYNRAETRTLYAMWPGSMNGTLPTGDAAAPKSRMVRAGSKKARERAIKAQATRRENIAKKAAANTPGTTAGHGTTFTGTVTASSASNAAGLTPPPSAGGGQ